MTKATECAGKPILYQITYLPHVQNNTPPFYYIGSTYRYARTYMGSPSARRPAWFTDGSSIKDWWKNETRCHPERFRFEILNCFDDTVTRDQLLEFEHNLHIDLNVLGHEYFNQAIATMGFTSSPRSEDVKKQLSESTKNYWNSPAGMEKRKRLSERNAQVKSKEMRRRWKNPTAAQLSMIKDKPVRQPSILAIKRINRAKCQRRLARLELKRKNLG